MGLINFLREKYSRRATASDLGNKVAVLWNPQGSRDFGEIPVWREGVIDEVSADGSFFIDFGGATMVCCATNYGIRRNPFKNIKEL